MRAAAGDGPDPGALIDRLADRATRLRELMIGSGTAAACLQALEPLRVAGAFGERPSPGAAADALAQVLLLSLAHGRRQAMLAGAARGTQPEVPWELRTTSPLLDAMLRAIAPACARGEVAGAIEGARRDLQRPDAEAVLRPGGPGVLDAHDRFLARYAPQQRRSRGVYFTPPQLVRHVVAGVDRILRDELGVDGGLAADGLVVLDPAAGAGAFLLEALEWMVPGGDDPAALASALSRLAGFEILLSAHAVGHLRLSERVHAGGLDPGEHPVPVLLGSGLRPPAPSLATPVDSALSAAVERERARAIALHGGGGVDVVLGNPPYRRSSSNRHAEIDRMMVPYKAPLSDEPNLQPLADDYIKFMRKAQVLLEARPCGVLGFVTPSTFLSGRLHRGMRESLLSTFDRVDVLDLHGSARGERPRGEGRDENVFGVGVGVAVSLWRRGTRGPPQVRHGELRGTRAEKLARLRRGDAPVPNVLTPVPPAFLLRPVAMTPPEYAAFAPLEALFDFHSVAGKPGDDRLLVSFDGAELPARLAAARKETASGVRVTEARRRLAARAASRPFSDDAVRPYAYRPFDTRFVYDEPEIWTRPVRELRRHLDGRPLLLVSRVVKDPEFAHVFVSTRLPDVILLSATSSVNCHVFPRSALRADALGVGCGGDRVFAYVYGILHSPGYRRRYREALRADYPRVPVPRSEALFDAVADAGERLIGLHLMEGPRDGARAPAAPATGARFVDGGDRRVRRVGESGRRLAAVRGGRGALAINDVSAFEGVAVGAFRHRIGGHAVAAKWLQDRMRARRSLSEGDAIQYLRLLDALTRTRQQMAAVERAIRAAGGWPRAFRGAEK
ncbi:MAG: N-6 DNA methylase [Myxococcales bacterium]